MKTEPEFGVQAAPITPAWPVHLRSLILSAIMVPGLSLKAIKGNHYNDLCIMWNDLKGSAWVDVVRMAVNIRLIRYIMVDFGSGVWSLVEFEVLQDFHVSLKGIIQASSFAVSHVRYMIGESPFLSEKYLRMDNDGMFFTGPRAKWLEYKYDFDFLAHVHGVREGTDRRAFGALETLAHRGHEGARALVDAQYAEEFYTAWYEHGYPANM